MASGPVQRCLSGATAPTRDRDEAAVDRDNTIDPAYTIAGHCDDALQYGATGRENTTRSSELLSRRRQPHSDEVTYFEPLR